MIGLPAAPFRSHSPEVEGAAGLPGPAEATKSVAMQLIDQRRDYDQIEGDHCSSGVIEANVFPRWR